MEFVSGVVTWEESVSPTTRILACDAQTSGGLLISLPAERADELVAKLRGAGVEEAVRIGRIPAAGAGRLRVR